MRYTIIIGCGRLGANLAATLSHNGENVCVIDKSEEQFKKLPQSYSGMTIIGNGADANTLKQADITSATAVVVVTNVDNVNIFIAQFIKEYYPEIQVIARLYDPEKELVYKEFEIDTISPAVLSTKEIDRMLNL